MWKTYAGQLGVHVHGTGIDVIDPGANEVVALLASDADAMIHANESSYVLKSNGGTLTRIIEDNNGKVMAPYLWQSGTVPNITSKNGADMVVIPDASGIPHMLIYKQGCGSSNLVRLTYQGCY